MTNATTLAAASLHLLLLFGDFLICLEKMIWSVMDFLNLFLNGDFLNLLFLIDYSVDLSFLIVNFLNCSVASVGFSIDARFLIDARFSNADFSNFFLGVVALYSVSSSDAHLLRYAVLNCASL